MISSTLFQFSEDFEFTRIKKAREGPGIRTATVLDGLAIHGGASPYNYERLSNKVAHVRALSSFHCGALISTAPYSVKKELAENSDSTGIAARPWAPRAR